MEIAKDMKKDVLITIKGTQRVGGESDVIEMMTTAGFTARTSCTTSAMRRPKPPAMRGAGPR